MIRLVLPPGAESPELAAALRERPSEPALLLVPESWCYRVQRSAPPGGWKTRHLQMQRPALFPESPDALHWDEELAEEDGTWQVWALPMERLDSALGGLAPLLWTPGRKVRVRPDASAGGEDLRAFPNLAPKAHRMRRIPWRRIRRRALVFGPLAAAVLAVAMLGVHLRNAWQGLDSQLRAETEATAALDKDWHSGRQQLDVLRRQASPGQQGAPWLMDLDALTRLLPEDTRLLGLRWTPQEVQLDLVTPHPESIQDILEASPEFKGIRFIGNMDRQGEFSRLTLHCQNEAAR